MTDRQTRSTHWSVTINNPCTADHENISNARQRNWKVEGQLEKGENGTTHYQLLVKTPQMRFSALKKAFPRAHIEIARNPTALSQYVHKDETRVGDLPEQPDKYPSLNKLWDLITDIIEEKYNTNYSTFNEEQFLTEFDYAIQELIIEGYHVETMGVNPQIRSAFKKYALQLMFRSNKLRRQTDRQTDEEIVPDNDISDGIHEENNNN